MRRSGLVAAIVGLALSSGASSAWAAPSIPFTTTALDGSAPVNRTVGVLLVRHSNGRQAPCSAAVVDAPNRSTIVTAGHCVDNATEGGTVSAAFTPGTQHGSAPFGSWDVSQLTAPNGWLASFNRHYDFAFGVIARNPARQAIEDVTGGLPIAFNQPRQQPYTVLGYPAQPSPPYDGTSPWACQSSGEVDDTPAPPDPTMLQVGCDFEFGSSGGPWLGSGGSVASVTSGGTPGIPVLEGAYFGDAAAALYNSVGNVPTVVPPPRCRKAKHKKAAAAKKRKCKKKKRA